MARKIDNDRLLTAARRMVDALFQERGIGAVKAAGFELAAAARCNMRGEEIEEGGR